MDFIRNAIAANCRLDGQDLDAQPKLSVELNVSAVAHGSCRVTLGDTVVITTVTFTVSTPTKALPDEGILEITLGSPFTLEDTEIADKRDERMEDTLESLQFQRHNFDKRLLCILPSQFVWTLKIHSTLLQRGGSPVDAISIAMLVALRTARIPNIDVIMRDEMERSKHGTNVRVRIAEGYNIDMNKLALQLPVCVTVAKIAGCHVWGVTKEEEACADGFLTVAVGPEGKCMGMRVTGSSFALPVIGELTVKSCRMGLLYHQQVMQTLCESA